MQVEEPSVDPSNSKCTLLYEACCLAQARCPRFPGARPGTKVCRQRLCMCFDQVRLLGTEKGQRKGLAQP